MAHIQIQTLASALRDLRSKVDILPFDTDFSEESIRLEPQRTIDSNKWGVGTVETWNKHLRRKGNADEIWKNGIYFLDSYGISINVNFSYFMDGIQRTTPVGKIWLRKSSFESVPIHFAQIGIVLLKREKLKLYKANEKIKLLFEYPNEFVRSSTNVSELKGDLLGDLRNRVGNMVEMVDTSYRIASLKESEKENYAPNKIITLDGIDYPRITDEELWQWCSDPTRFRGQARRWTTRYRDILEQNIYDEALENFGSNVKVGEKYNLIIKDGPLTHVRGPATKAALGVIKTFRTLFLKRTQMTTILSLPVGYRSPVFTLTRPDGNPEEGEMFNFDSSLKDHRNKLVSWYVRIRPVERHDPSWGLLRLEMHVSALPCEGHAGRWNLNDTSVVDEISRQILKEASPSSHPDPRWHNLIYPVRCCEFFLRSRILSHLTARYLLGGN